MMKWRFCEEMKVGASVFMSALIVSTIRMIGEYFQQ